jgi:nucleotide-binding universal stress UspA family protein
VDSPRVILAYDLSREAHRALESLAGIAWPPGTTLRIVTSPVGVGDRLSTFAGVDETLADRRQLETVIARAHEDAGRLLKAHAIDVETVVVGGGPGKAVVRDAQEWEADLIVAGARTQGRIAATLLGSVSTELAEKAPCSVLIVRVEARARVILAVADAGPAAAMTADVVADWPLFADAEIRVVGILPTRRRYVGQVLSDEDVASTYGDEDAAAAEALALALDGATERIGATGRQAQRIVRTGVPGEEIIAAAREWPADIVVLPAGGSSPVRGEGLAPVARTVLHGTHASVLIVRPR